MHIYTYVHLELQVVITTTHTAVGSCVAILTSEPSPLEGATVCPGEIRLVCVTVNTTSDTIRWFDNDTGANFVASPFNSDEPLPVTLEQIMPVVGITVDLISKMNTGYESIMTVNLSQYDATNVRSFSCGGFGNEKSNTISLNFTIKGKGIS